MPRLYVRDDEGELWFLEDGRIRMLGAELDCNGDIDPENGYPANSWAKAIKLLNEQGYIQVVVSECKHNWQPCEKSKGDWVHRCSKCGLCDW